MVSVVSEIQSGMCAKLLSYLKRYPVAVQLQAPEGDMKQSAPSATVIVVVIVTVTVIVIVSAVVIVIKAKQQSTRRSQPPGLVDSALHTSFCPSPGALGLETWSWRKKRCTSVWRPGSERVCSYYRGLNG